MHTEGGRRSAKARRWMTLLRLASCPAALFLAAMLVGQQPAIAARPTTQTLTGQQVPSTHGTPVTPPARPVVPHGAQAPAPVQVTWPAAGSATVDVPFGATAAGTREGTAADRQVRAGGLPVWLGPPEAPGTAAPGRTAPGVSRVSVSLLDRQRVPAGWRNGVVLKVSRADGVATPGRARVTVDYSGFAGAFGGDYASRLRLVVVPDCAPSTKDPAGCAATPLDTRNETTLHTLSADVGLPAAGGNVMVAAVAGPSSPSGTFKATSLSPSSSWSAGGNSGDFSWQYPIDVPPSLGGPTPGIAVSYSSSSVDGRNATTNNQPEWTGEGFALWPGYISRSYKPCADDEGGGANNTTDTGDSCWGTDNAVVSMSGHSGELVKDDGGAGWHLKDDDNTKIEHLTGASNGDNDGEYWRLTTSDGTQYYFGLNRLPGYTGTAPANKTTSSAWTEPVAGNNPNEPCHAASFTGSFCQQAWRWNLDYAVDVHGNTMSVFYGTESNNYARNLTDTDVQSYVRGGYVDHIDYGTDNRSGTDTEQTSTAAPMRVQFATADRCLSSCGTHDVAHWPDTPWDQSCTSGTSCPGLYSMTFWTTKRLATITTQVWDPSAGGYKDVDLWTLTHSFPPSGDDTRDGMWLSSITHTGKATGAAVVGSAVAMPSVSFDWTQMPNRVDPGTDHEPPMNWMRLSTIWTDTGGKIDIRYTPQDCVAGSRMPASPQSNTLRCYPVLEQQPDKSIKTEYFHKYLVAQVTQADWTGGGLDVNTSYTYVGNPAWRHTDDDGMTKDNLRTWSDFRGYPQVNTQVGQVGGGQQTLSETTFFQGMNGDLNGSGGTRSVTLPAIDVNGDGNTTGTADAPAVPDEDAYSGTPRQSTVYNGVESAPVSTTVYQPWQSAATASRNMGQTIVYARHTATATTWAGTNLASGGARVTRQDSTFDSYGMPTQVDDAGDVAVSGDEQCTKTSYNRNPAKNLLVQVAEGDTYALSCARVASPGPATEADVVGMTRTLYDHQAFTTAPAFGDLTETDKAKAWSPQTGPTWLVDSTATYDLYGRPTDVTDVRGNHTNTAYTPATGGPVTSLAQTTTLGTTTTTLEPSWGAETAVVDVNGKRTDTTYDALGRTSQVWRPNHPKASFPTLPSASYAYTLRNTGGVNAITTNELNAANAYTTTIDLYDGLLRERQRQTASLANGHSGTVFAETVYDGNGRETQQSQYFDATVQPSTTLFSILSWQPKTQTVTQYDRANRPVAKVFNSQGIEQWRSTTTYGGDRVSVTPPPGGTATTTVTDAHGRTTELRQYHNPSDVGSDTRSLYDRVQYHFNAKGLQDSWTDNADNTWTASFDLLGRQVSSHDPDTGNGSATYSDTGDVLTTTDGRGQTLAYTYDSLGRATGEYTPTVTGTKLATWTYDPVGAVGMVASQSRWVGTDEYKTKINGYTPLYQPTSETYTIPASQTGLAGSYTFSHSYKVDGSPATLGYPNAGGLGAETLTYTYDPTDGLAEQLQTNFPGVGQYVANTDYDAYGQLTFVSYQTTAGNFLQRSFTYDDATHRLNDALTIRQVSPQAVDDVKYSYDAAGNITKILDTPATGGADVQCFGYDYAKRLADAWTPSSGDCNQAKSATALGGPAPYWQSWTFDPSGSRKTQVTHGVAGDTTATSSYPQSGANSTRPHTVGSVTVLGPGVNRTDNYGYDNSGNTTGRPGPTAAQTLTWDAEGHLATVAENGNTTRYTYDPTGNRLIQDTPTSTTLYLPGEDLVRDKSTGTVTATRFYGFAGQDVAALTSGGQLTWLVNDLQGTQQVAVAAGNQTTTQRRQTPYGSARGGNPTWPDSRGFVGGTTDPTGLVHEGAREYDPNLGRFLSSDPVFLPDNPQGWNGYGYADNTPVTASDPSGECPSWLCGPAKSLANGISSALSGLGHALSSAVSGLHSFISFTAGLVVSGIKAAVHGLNLVLNKGLSLAKHAINALRTTMAKAEHYVAQHWRNAFKRTWHVVRFVVNAPSTAAGLWLADRSGAKCSRYRGLMIVCSGSSVIPKGKSGFTIGNVFLRSSTDPVSDTEMQHETMHSTQYFFLGGGLVPFLPLYLKASLDSIIIYKIKGPRHDSQGNVCDTPEACYNIFEMQADLHKGGYYHP